MELNSIEFPPHVIAELYPSSLIETPRGVDHGTTKGKTGSSSRTPNADQDKPTTYLGNNHKNVLVIVDHKNVLHIPDKELELLTGILAACKLSMQDIALVNIQNKKGQTYKDLNGQFKPTTVLLFDTPPSSIDLPMNFPHFQPQLFNGVTYLYSPALKEFENDRVVKSKLWICLKKIFGL